MRDRPFAPATHPPPRVNRHACVTISPPSRQTGCWPRRPVLPQRTPPTRARFCPGRTDTASCPQSTTGPVVDGERPSIGRLGHRAARGDLSRLNAVSVARSRSEHGRRGALLQTWRRTQQHVWPAGGLSVHTGVSV